MPVQGVSDGTEDLAIGIALPIIAVAAAVAGTVVSASAAAQNAKAQQNAANYQAQVSENNALLNQQQAQQTAAAGEGATVQKELETRARLGGIRAAQAASGTDVDTGSNVDVRSSAAELGQLDALTIRSNYARQAYGYQTGATSQQAQSGLYSMQAGSAAASAPYAVGGSLLSGASGAAKSYLGFQQAYGTGGGGGNGLGSNINNYANAQPNVALI